MYPEIFAANGNQPPRECICDKEESNCELFNFTYVPEGAFVDQQALYYAWDRVSAYVCTCILYVYM